MIYNVVLVSGVQQSDSVIYIYTHIYSFSDSSLIYITTEYRVKFSVLCSRSLLIILLIYIGCVC